MQMALKFIVWLRQQREGGGRVDAEQLFGSALFNTDSLRAAWIRVIISYSVYVHPFDFLIKAVLFFPLSVFFPLRFRDVSPEAEPLSGCCRRCWVGTDGCFLFVCFVPETEVRQVTCSFDTELWIIDVLVKVFAALQWQTSSHLSMFTVFSKRNKHYVFDVTLQLKVVLFLSCSLGLVHWVTDLTPSRCELMFWCWSEATAEQNFEQLRKTWFWQEVSSSSWCFRCSFAHIQDSLNPSFDKIWRSSENP